jgi:hypothetical protein
MPETVVLAGLPTAFEMASDLAWSSERFGERRATNRSPNRSYGASVDSTARRFTPR